MSTTRKLSPGDIVSQLATLANWTQEGEALKRTCKFKSYQATIDYVVLAAGAAEAMNHHPDLLVTWRKIEVTLSTHSAGGITDLDFNLAKRMEELYAPYA